MIVFADPTNIKKVVSVNLTADEIETIMNALNIYGCYQGGEGQMRANEIGKQFGKIAEEQYGADVGFWSRIARKFKVTIKAKA